MLVVNRPNPFGPTVPYTQRDDRILTEPETLESLPAARSRVLELMGNPVAIALQDRRRHGEWAQHSVNAQQWAAQPVEAGYPVQIVGRGDGGLQLIWQIESVLAGSRHIREEWHETIWPSVPVESRFGPITLSPGLRSLVPVGDGPQLTVFQSRDYSPALLDEQPWLEKISIRAYPQPVVLWVADATAKNHDKNLLALKTARLATMQFTDAEQAFLQALGIAPDSVSPHIDDPTYIDLSGTAIAVQAPYQGDIASAWATMTPPAGTVPVLATRGHAGERDPWIVVVPLSWLTGIPTDTGTARIDINGLRLCLSRV